MVSRNYVAWSRAKKRGGFLSFLHQCVFIFEGVEFNSCNLPCVL